ncbi:hypothetical protein [Mycobacterium sp. M26]|uniref:hypothetical protein n=1 Tax=Mycobacterium sp. M26 TaxID=1762962 RepID=UPI00073F51F1|nr:hypothetical protein [Mycobacterium sp. M26]
MTEFRDDSRAPHTDVAVSRIDHAMTRLNIATGIPFERFRAAFESAVPAFNPEPYLADIRAGGTWDDVKSRVAASAPYDLLLYASIDATPMMNVAGHRGQAIEYLMGNHVIAETMFRRDRNALLYAPLRVLLFSDEAGAAVFGIDQPSTVFAGLGDSEIAATGILLDRKVATMLRAIGVGISDELTATADHRNTEPRRS